MPLESYSNLLKDAQSRKYAVGAFNIFSMAFLPSILEVAEEQRSPVLLQVTPVHFHMMEIEPYIAYVKACVAKVSVPVGLNLDHGTDEATIIKAIRYGFPAVMFDASRLPYNENLSRTKNIVTICHACGVDVEAELGTLNDEALESSDSLEGFLFTDPDAAAEFCSQTQIDALAVSIGNVHGIYRREPNLDFNRLTSIARKTGTPLVLHGGSGIPDADFQRAIELGINKINIYTDMSVAAYAKLKQVLHDQPKLVDYPAILYQGRKAVKEIVRHKLQVFGSAGKA